jgi:hypothetical protein
MEEVLVDHDTWCCQADQCHLLTATGGSRGALQMTLVELSNHIEDIKNEIEKVKTLKCISVSTYEVKNRHPIFKKVLETIAKTLEMKITFEPLINNPNMSCSFKDDEKKIYEFSIHTGSMKEVYLQVIYLSTEHTSLMCNSPDEALGYLLLNGKTSKEILDWIGGLRGKKRIVNCHYCGEIVYE